MSTDPSQPAAWPLRLITEMPLTGLSEPIQNLRYTLLRGTCYSADAEQQAIVDTEERIYQQLPRLFRADDLAGTQNTSVVDVPNPTVRLEICTWLRQQVAGSMEFVERYVISRAHHGKIPNFKQGCNAVNVILGVLQLD